MVCSRNTKQLSGLSFTRSDTVTECKEPVVALRYVGCYVSVKWLCRILSRLVGSNASSK